MDVSYRRIIPFGPFDKSFSEDPNDYFYFGEQVPPMTLSRSLRKGDILEVAVLSITNPGKNVYVPWTQILTNNCWKTAQAS